MIRISTGVLMKTFNNFLLRPQLSYFCPSFFLLNPTFFLLFENLWSYFSLAFSSGCA